MHKSIGALLLTLATGCALATPPTGPTPPGDPCGAAAAPYAGSYRLADGSDLHVLNLRDRHHAAFGNGKPVPLDEVTRGRFASGRGEVQLDFCAAGQGQDVLVSRSDGRARIAGVMTGEIRTP